MLAIRMRRQTESMLCAAASAAIIGVTPAVFLIWTFPADQATANWTVAPDDWQILRSQWESSHAVNAALTFVALCATTASALIRPR